MPLLSALYPAESPAKRSLGYRVHSSHVNATRSPLHVGCRSLLGPGD